MVGSTACMDRALLAHQYSKALSMRPFCTDSRCMFQSGITKALNNHTEHGITRRRLNLLCLNVPGMLMSLGQPSDKQRAAKLVQNGMRSFRKGDVAASVREFDEAMRLDPGLRPYLWQRGLSLYYAEQYEEAARQFRDDVAVNPADTEEAIWAFLSEAKIIGASKARLQFLQVGRDPRDIMRAAYSAFQDGSNPDRIVNAADLRRPSDAFYANLYCALFCEAEDKRAESADAIQTALQTPYAKQSGDYMVAVAQVHARLRGISSPTI